MDDWGAKRWIRFGVERSLGLGALIGGVETLLWSLRSVQPFTFGESLVHYLATALMMTALCGLLGLILSPLYLMRKEGVFSRMLATQMALVSGIVLSLYLLPMAAQVLRDGRPVGWMLAVMPVMGAVVVWFNAKTWLARAAFGKSHAPWLPLSIALSVLCGLIGITVQQVRNEGGGAALDGDPSMVLITVDGLGRAQGGPESMPSLAAWQELSTTFEGLALPSAASLPNHASLMVGVHPLRVDVLSAGDRLSQQYPTIVERYVREGYATGGFVSAATVDRQTGLGQGFLTFDDAAQGPLRSLRGIWLYEEWLAPLVESGRRSDLVTIAQARTWLARHHQHPFVLWVHLAGPMAADADEAQQAYSQTDEAMGALLEDLVTYEVLDRTLVFIAGTTGRGEGKRGRGVSDDKTLGSLIYRSPNTPQGPRTVDAQVRLVEIPQTMMVFSGFTQAEGLEGVDLEGYVEGKRERSLGVVFVGQDDDGEWLIGTRTGWYKYVEELSSGDAVLYDLREDPQQSHSIAEERPELAEQLRDATRDRREALKKDVRSRGDEVLRKQLESLGY